MAGFTARLPEAAWGHIRQECARHGLQIRAAIEGALEAFLELNDQGSQPPAVLAVWERARDFDEEFAGGGAERLKRNIRIDDDLMARVRVACQRHDVSVNGLMAAGLTPRRWPTRAQGKVMSACWLRAIDLARQREWQRRMGRAGRSDIPQANTA